MYAFMCTVYACVCDLCTGALQSGEIARKFIVLFHNIKMI